jgi:signal transduction histidine kinase
MWKDAEKFKAALKDQEWSRECSLTDSFQDRLLGWIRQDVFPNFMAEVVSHVDSIVEIDPDLPERQILTLATRYMVDFLGALSASVRIYDPATGRMLSYGSYPYQEKERETFIPLEKSVAGEVVKTQKPYFVTNIDEDPLYRDKSIVRKKGANSLMAIPLAIPRFYPHERDTVGVIQIYYPEKNRTFATLEVQASAVMARRLSFAMARKKILSLFRVNEKKEAIVRKIFLTLGMREGVKMRDVFNRVIPELTDIVNVQSCALFSVSEDMEHVVLEAGYPDYAGYHGIGKSFAVASEPVFEMVLNRKFYGEETPYEVVTPSYVLVRDPQNSRIISRNLRQFAVGHNINSILYIPLNVGEEITHFITFDALDQRKRYAEEEIEIFLFLGRELMKAQRMERLDDILHDFKNPALATAGFARRLKNMLDQGDLKRNDPMAKKYLEILLEETSRLQEMALSLYHRGEQQVINFTQVLKNRFEINKEAIRELLKQDIVLQEGPFEDPLHVRCYPMHLERILDNLLNNATNAIPPQGGLLSIKTYWDGKWACAEITNSGLMSEEERLRLLEGEGRGRGLYITHRIIGILKGKIDIRLGKNTTTLIVCLPPESASKGEE